MSLAADYPARLVCRLLDFPRCRLYRAAPVDATADAPLRELQELIVLSYQAPPCPAKD